MENNTQKIHDLLSTASASYANISSSSSLIFDLINRGAAHTEQQARQFADKYTFLHQSDFDLSGFSATLFQDDTGKKVLAFRVNQYIAFGFLCMLIKN